ncbi:MAG: hypothetical protein CMM55_02590 [Rhodospirillaceae bacterium]|nr:hypothetical protein [Rhodospirillaceae bacterium]
MKDIKATSVAPVAPVRAIANILSDSVCKVCLFSATYGWLVLSTALEFCADWQHVLTVSRLVQTPTVVRQEIKVY